MDVVGLAAYAHDSAACLVRDGLPLALAEEERFVRVKHTDVFPKGALDYCLKVGATTLAELDEVALSWDPWFGFEKRLWNLIKHLPQSMAFSGHHRKKWRNLTKVEQLLRAEL